MNLRFGAVPFDVVNKALGTTQEFLHISSTGKKPCRMVGPLIPYGDMPQDILVEVAREIGVPGLDYTRPIQAYHVGFDYYNDPRYDGVSHGMAFVQDEQFHCLDYPG